MRNEREYPRHALAGLVDTDPEADAVQRALFRHAGPEGRAHAAVSLSDALVRLVKDALGRAHSDATAQELDIAFVERCYGRELARAVRAHLAGRQVP